MFNIWPTEKMKPLICSICQFCGVNIPIMADFMCHFHPLGYVSENSWEEMYTCGPGELVKAHSSTSLPRILSYHKKKFLACCSACTYVLCLAVPLGFLKF